MTQPVPPEESQLPEESQPPVERASASVLSDAEIDRLSDEQRADLMLRLHRDVELTLPRNLSVRTVRRARMSLLTISSVVLVPWIVYLATSLPTEYQASHWPETWAGYDVGLASMMALTVLLGARRSPLVVLTSFATGVLLVCDAWFDMMTAEPHDLPEAIASAALAELPIAALLMISSLRILHHLAVRTWGLEPGQPIWHWRMVHLGGPR